MRQNECSFSVIEARYRIGSGTVQRILKRFAASGMTLNELKAMDPSAVEDLIYSPESQQRKDIPLPDFQHYHDCIHSKGSKVNISFCWIEYKEEHPDGYGQTQFYEYYNRFVEATYGGQTSKMAVERVPGEKMYIDRVGDKPDLLTDHRWGRCR